ncbi:flavodoxin reductase family protein [Bernardetia litoralis DSM 6794]|uniref:Flavodoxin reductase family protein n=1 Tax=Bernardetia litoralis (strain ATCC 23117 / DSM 6794 / NBRC 15988 / NCIMB 1366 / Fx l1 / Sio-4) TaxID=880071 RepID=I4AG46_BERLS|nr:ferredoxin--NADP reductase [Bernardetia litoralis]AFM02931.1 flavodoxin reductase family protein [Bernardetia litoralis DSM 6794]
MSSNRYQTLKIKEIVKETSDTITIHLKQPLFRKIPYYAGQFLTLIVKDTNGKKYRRAYSLCSAPHLDSMLAVTIKRVEGGIVSNLLNDTLKAGDKLEIMEPIGNFVLRTHPDNKRHIVLFGGGSGITPLMSMLKVALSYEQNSVVSLIYTCRNEESIIFKNQLDKLKEKHGDRFNLIYVLTQPKTDLSNQDNYFEGRISKEFIKNTLEKLPNTNNLEDKIFYLCGPEGMMETIQETLSEINISKDTVHKENFFAPVTEENNTEKNTSDSRKTVKVVLNGEEVELNVAPKKTILDAALDDEIDMPYSCQSGLCTACRGLCTSGKVTMDSNEALSEAEIIEGYILTCQAHPLTDDVKIDMDA